MSAIKLTDQYVYGWTPANGAGRKHRYFSLPELTVVANRAVYHWSVTGQYYIVDYDPMMRIHDVRKAFMDQMELNWPNNRIRVTPIDIPADALLHHTPPVGWSLALHGLTPRRLVHCE